MVSETIEAKIHIFRKKSKKRYNLGVILFFVADLVLISSLFFDYDQLGKKIFYYIFINIVFFAILLAIGIFLLARGSLYSRLIDSVEIFKELSPDELTITEKYVVARKGDIYLLSAPSKNIGIYLFRFNTLSECSNSKIKIPKRFSYRSFKKNIAGKFKVARVEGEFVIPTGKNKFSKGRGVLYFISNMIGRPYAVVLSKETISMAMEELSKEIV